MMNGFNDTVGVPLRNFDRNKRSDFGKCKIKATDFKIRSDNFYGEWLHF